MATQAQEANALTSAISEASKIRKQVQTINAAKIALRTAQGDLQRSLSYVKPLLSQEQIDLLVGDALERTV